MPARILTAIAGGGQLERHGADDSLERFPAVEAFVEQVLQLGDDERHAVAEARKQIDEARQAKALRAAAEALAVTGRRSAYIETRERLALAHLSDEPVGGDASAPSTDELARRHETVRLLRLAIDDAVLALLTTDVLHPKHLRELYRPWQEVLVARSRPPVS